MQDDNGIDIPGPIDWEQASHWITYDTEAYTVETWCKMGPDYKYTLRTRIRPMCESEIIHAKLSDHSREAVLRCHGIIEGDIERLLTDNKNKLYRYQKWVKILTVINVLVAIASMICIYISLFVVRC